MFSALWHPRISVKKIVSVVSLEHSHGEYNNLIENQLNFGGKKMGKYSHLFLPCWIYTIIFDNSKYNLVQFSTI